MVDIFGNKASIEEHYQLSKRFDNISGLTVPQNIKDAKGKKPSHFVVNGRVFDIKYLSSYYSLLWIKYLDTNPGLVNYVKGFDDFTDMFRGKSQNCQADVVKKYVKQGRQFILKECSEFIKILKTTPSVIEVEGDLLEAKEDIYGHQVNCLGIMEAGIALQIKKRFSTVYSQYKKCCEENDKNKSLLGCCFIVPTESGKSIANLFGQYEIGVGKVRTEYRHLEASLMALKDFAKKNRLSVGLPFQLGSGLAGGDWNVIKDIIKNVFDDYSVTIYKLPNI